MDFLFLQNILILKPFLYLIVFLGMVAEGEAVLFSVAFLTSQGFFNLAYIFPTVFLGAFLGDFVWYWLGSKIKTPSFFLLRWLEKLAQPFDEHLINYPSRTFFLSKFIYGIHHGIVLRAGALGVNLKKFAKIDFVSTFIWILLIIGFGYLSSYSFFLVKRYLKFAEIGLLIGLIVYFFFSRLLSFVSKKKL